MPVMNLNSDFLILTKFLCPFGQKFVKALFFCIESEDSISVCQLFY